MITIVPYREAWPAEFAALGAELRATPLAANAYGEIKRQLARHFPTDMDAYYDLKDPVCDALMAGAFVWAEVTG